MFKRSLILLSALATMSACSGSGAMPPAIHSGQTGLGTVLTDARGMTLYTYDKDPRGKSLCNGNCAEIWPPLAAAPNAKASGAFTIVKRDDGSRQWAYQGKPLYGWYKDTKPGDITGHGFKNVWTAARVTDDARDALNDGGGGDGGGGGGGGGDGGY